MADDKQGQEQLKNIQEQGANAKALADTYEKMVKNKKQLNQIEKDTLDISKQLVQTSAAIENSIQRRLDKSSTVKQLTESLKKLERERADFEGNAIKLSNARLEAQKKFQKLDNERIDKANQLYQLEGDYNRDLTLQLQKEAELASLAGSRAKADKDKAKMLAAEVAQGKVDLNITQKRIVQKEKEIQLAEEAVNKQHGLVEQINDTITANDKIKKQLEEEVVLTKKTLALKQASGVLDGLAEATGLKKLKDTLTLVGVFKFFLDAAFKADNHITQLGKSLGVSREVASKLRDNMVAYNTASKDAFMNMDRQMKAQEGLTESLGIAVDFGNEERETFARLTEITGLAKEEAGKLAIFSAATGKTTKNYVSDLRVAGMEAARANKIHISDKELLSSVAKLSAGILVKFQGNPKALAQAVVETKKLGSSLEQIDKIGDSLLDWESSINNELEAELITGRKINLEKAREAALNGNQLDLTRAIADQVGSLADFQNMNVIAQGSLAKAFGLSRDEMSEMLMKQEAINKYGDKANELNATQIEDMERRNMSAEEYLNMVDNQRSIQEKFNDAMVKLQEIIGNLVAGPFGDFLAGLANALQHTTVLKGIIFAIGAYMTIGWVKSVISFAQGIVAAIPKALTLLGITEATTAAEVAGAEAASFGAATLWITAGLAAVMGAIAGYAMKDGEINPKKGPILFGEFGSVRLDPNDKAMYGADGNIKVGTNLMGNTGGGGVAAIDLSSVTSGLDKVYNAIVNKNTTIQMDAEQVGKMVGRETRTGTEQTKSNYKLA